MEDQPQHFGETFGSPQKNKPQKYQMAETIREEFEEKHGKENFAIGFKILNDHKLDEEGEQEVKRKLDDLVKGEDDVNKFYDHLMTYKVLLSVM